MTHSLAWCPYWHQARNPRCRSVDPKVFFRTTGKLSEKVLTRIQTEVSERGLFAWWTDLIPTRTRHGCAAGALVERFIRLRPSMPYGLGVSYKLTIPNFPTYLVKAISKYHIYGCFRRPSAQPHPCAWRRRAGVAEVGFVSPVFFSLTWKTLPCHSVDDTAFIFPVIYPEAYLDIGAEGSPPKPGGALAFPFIRSLRCDHIRALGQRQAQSQL